MSRNAFLDSGFSDEVATVYSLEANSAAAIAAFIHTRFPRNQVAAAKHLGLHQSEVSALLAGNIGRFSLSKLIRIARRAGLRLFLDMGDNANGTCVDSLMPTMVTMVNVARPQLNVELLDEASTDATRASPPAATVSKSARH